MKLRELRQKMGLTLKQLSDNSGVSIQQLSRYERGEIKPSADALANIAKALDTSVEDVLKGEPRVMKVEQSKKENDEQPFDRLIKIIESQQELIKKLVELIS